MKRTLMALLALTLSYSVPISADTSSQPTMKDHLEDRIQEQEMTGETTAQEYGIILNGDDSELHLRNVSLAYQGMQDIGISSDNIYVLSVPETEGYMDSPIIHLAPSDKETTEEIFMSQLPQLIDEQDTVMIYITGHGVDYNSSSAVHLDNVLMPAQHYARTIDRMDAALAITISDTCYSGDFLSSLEDIDDPYIAISSTEGKERTCCAVFADTFWNNVTNPSADDNRDGIITLEELFSYTNRYHSNHITNHHTDLNGDSGLYKTNTTPDSYRITY